tara:strand:- start:675 stop:866 length:192 start_codon:yes stop_codon:yes gene_type:complete
MEGSGTVGIMKARQARCVKVARRKVVQGELRSGRHGVTGNGCKGEAKQARLNFNYSLTIFSYG